MGETCRMTIRVMAVQRREGSLGPGRGGSKFEFDLVEKDFCQEKAGSV